MHRILMNLLTLTFLFVNIQSDTTPLTDKSIASNRPEVIYETSSRSSSSRSSGNEEVAESDAESSTIVYQNVRGIGVKVKNVNNRHMTDYSQDQEQQDGQQDDQQESDDREDEAKAEANLKTSESATTYTPIQPVYMPMDSLPGLDLEIDAMGLGGVPPGVRIETRNGRPVVEILPNLDLMHSMHQDVRSGKSHIMTKTEEYLADHDREERKKMRRKGKGKGKKYKSVVHRMKSTPAPTADPQDDDNEDEAEDHIPDPDDDMTDNDAATKHLPESRKKSENARMYYPQSDNSSFFAGRNIKEIKMRSSSQKRTPDVDLERVTRQQMKDQGTQDGSGTTDAGGDSMTTPHAPRDLSDPRVYQSGRRINKSLWSYEEEDKWSRRYPSCSGSSQSPINLTPKLIHEEKDLTLDFTSRYNFKLPKANLINTGLTLELLFDGSDSRPGITGTGVYDDMYLFEKMHLHWGSKNTIGSEHSIFGQKFPVEIHLVHYNDKYKSLEEAFDKPDGLCVIAVFLQVSNTDNPRFSKLLSHLSSVECGGQSSSLKDQISLSSFLPSNRKEFYRYQGSLTTPPCSESVTWIILKHGLLISKSQLKKIRELKQHDCQTAITNNWRNLQPAHGRRIEKAVQAN